MSDERFTHEPSGLVVVQPALEPRPRAMVKCGPVAMFFYFRLSSWTFGFEVFSAGGAITLGPLMFGAVLIKRQLAAFDAKLDTTP